MYQLAEIRELRSPWIFISRRRKRVLLAFCSKKKKPRISPAFRYRSRGFERMRSGLENDKYKLIKSHVTVLKLSVSRKN